ncbi:histidine phosphatase family protein [Natronorubrum bangense]|uniref:phosphoglycerate mutase (2,3-diphosphoglycerate-dependent) n=2 Tax=Natronorubrum bangense TaxID=61858 RepID=L9WGN0_9EURY|nr:histidine phosphatase family protein [Natronorubrum bangense]ELY48660.1 alpha-ribazole phosphatase [Natronorubrum bangense JCM 10635]QCC53943.1 histidine phosphatase family protein [Natronorubrum bangense]
MTQADHPNTDDDLRLLLVRHGESIYNEQNRLAGRTDVELNARGKRQAKALAERFRDTELDTVYSSSLSRALETATIASEPHGIDITTVDTLCERSFGRLEERHKPAVERSRAETNVNRSEWCPPGGETRQDVADRVVPFVERLIDEHRGEVVMIVAHSGVNKTLLAALTSGDCMWGHRIAQNNTALNVLEYNGSWTLERVNDTAHLEALR